MSEGTVHLTRQGHVATIIFDRVAARNSMTGSMYAELMQHCRLINSDRAIRAVVFRGAGAKAFVAGSDIGQFTTFRGSADGIKYEKQIDECIGLIEGLSMPTIAVVHGWAAGGGLLIASACDFRLGTAEARFAAPIAATVGNTLSMANMARLLHAWGMQRAKRMLLLAETINAQEAQQCGFLHRLLDSEELEAELQALTERLTSLAPVTQSVAKEALRRLVVHDLPVGDDLIHQAYGSRDFREGVQAFLDRHPPNWSGC